MLAATVGLAALAGAPAALAGTVNVHPDRPGAIGKGIDRAKRGDTVRVHGGRYEERVKIDKRVTLTAAGDGLPVVDGECDALFTIDVERNGVVVEGLKVVGAKNSVAAAEVNFPFIERGKARDLVLRDTCGNGPGAGAGYGVNVYQGERLTVVDNKAKGFSDAGVYIGSIGSTGAGELRVARNRTFENAQGIIVEEVKPAADVVVKENDTHDNGRGIFVHLSEDTEYRDNRIADNATGVHLDPGSDDNVFLGNAFTGNDTDLLDEGAGNCGSGNTPELFDPCV
jgi:nitrous oxidase accessory protein NosD